MRRLSAGPARAPRPIETRLVGVRRQLTVLLVALLRAKRVPARARCGFAGHFTPGNIVDDRLSRLARQGQGAMSDPLMFCTS
ncbi:hypothetical protein WMF26_16440 [Sorangium sp. So ce185]|uniref:hypothetical protein n=1 Tax=Sorangium sp. So ce185 TaxID=3133287 RepID=UPI003F620106